MLNLRYFPSNSPFLCTPSAMKSVKAKWSPWQVGRAHSSTAHHDTRADPHPQRLGISIATDLIIDRYCQLLDRILKLVRCNPVKIALVPASLNIRGSTELARPGSRFPQMNFSIRWQSERCAYEDSSASRSIVGIDRSAHRSTMTEIENHFTVFVRLPFNRGDFVDPPPVSSCLFIGFGTSNNYRLHGQVRRRPSFGM